MLCKLQNMTQMKNIFLSELCKTAEWTLKYNSKHCRTVRSYYMLLRESINLSGFLSPSFNLSVSVSLCLSVSNLHVCVSLCLSFCLPQSLFFFLRLSDTPSPIFLSLTASQKMTKCSFWGSTALVIPSYWNPFPYKFASAGWLHIELGLGCEQGHFSFRTTSTEHKTWTF